MSMHTDVYRRIPREEKKNQNTFPRRRGQNKPARGKKQEEASEDGNVNLNTAINEPDQRVLLARRLRARFWGATRDKRDSQTVDRCSKA
jgi:hypothetical protein